MVKRIGILFLAMSLLLGLSPAGATESAEPRTYTLMASVSSDHGDWDDMWFFDYVEEILGIRFEITQVSSESFAEKKNLAFATGTLPDLFIGGLSSAEIANYGAQGVILPLESYLNWENTPAVMSWFELIDGYEKALRYPDGHIYALNGLELSMRELATVRYWINNDWANQILGHLPVNLEEYYAYLKGVQENDMNGDGDVGNELPITGIFKGMMSNASYYDCVLPVLAAFGMVERTFEAKEGVVQFNPVIENFKMFLQYMNRLYTEGLIDPEYFTQTDDQFKAKLAQGLAGAFTDSAHWLNIPSEEIWRQYTSNSPMVSDYNDAQLWPAFTFKLKSEMFVITSRCGDPQDLLRLFNFLCTITPGEYEYIGGESKHEAFLGEYAQHILREDAGDVSQRFGAQLGTWDRMPEYGWRYIEYVTGEGKTAQKIDVVYPTEKYATRNAFVRSVMTPWAFPYISANMRIFDLDHFMTGDKEAELTMNVFTYNVPYYHNGMPTGIKYTSEESDEISILATDLGAYVDQTISKFIIGELEIESEWDGYVAGCESRGLSRYLELYQTAYDRLMEN